MAASLAEHFIASRLTSGGAENANVSSIRLRRSIFDRRDLETSGEMTSDQPEPSVAVPSFRPLPLQGSAKRNILLYLGVLTVLIGFAAPYGGLIYIPISFILKNKLHLSAHEVADFRLLAGVPLYFAVVFGLARDAFDPFGMKDRGFLLVFGLTGAVVYLCFAFLPLNYISLALSYILLTVCYLLIASAMRGLASVIGQRHSISGQVGTVWTVVSLLPSFVAVLLGGALSQRLEGEDAAHAGRIIFLIGAIVMMSIAAFSMAKTRDVFDEFHRDRGRQRSGWVDLKSLMKYWPVYPVLLISLLWYFMPGAGTPLQYYFQNTLHGTDVQWGEWNAIADISNIPALLAFGFLCRRVALRKLLVWGTIIGIPQTVPLLAMHSVTGGLLAAVPFGFMSAVATVAYLDLIIRSCPRGMQGTVLMAFYCLENIASRFGDVLGTRLYDYHGGFPVCVAATAGTSALIVPLLFLVPKHLVAKPDEA
jgi:MFS/sugar transport protein